ncbi:MAG TPA: hypothetical protein VKB81_19535, partial [Nitrospira sp.]|nr:hypothetical protein [Nitrospira sp.]
SKTWCFILYDGNLSRTFCPAWTKCFSLTPSAYLPMAYDALLSGASPTIPPARLTSRLKYYITSSELSTYFIG